MLPASNELKYQGIKLALSGRSLREVKAFMKSATMGLHEEYTSEEDLRDLMSLEGGLASLRSRAKKLAAIKFAPRKLLGGHSRAEFLSKFVTGIRTPLSWKRDGNLIRKGKPNKPKPGSSRGKVGRTRVIGAKQVLRDFRKLLAELRKLELTGKQQRRLLSQAAQSLKIAGSVNTGASL